MRVGVGWHGGIAGTAPPAAGDFITCRNGRSRASPMTGLCRVHGGAVRALALVPGDLKSADAAPLLCAGITTFNALRHSAPSPAIWSRSWHRAWTSGVQFAASWVQNRGDCARRDKAARKKLGAEIYIDSTTQNAAEELTSWVGRG